jgi:putative modified peptide
VGANIYGDERLGRLLRIFRPAPHAWVIRAKQIVVDDRISDTPAPARKLLTNGDLARLQRTLDADPMFRRRFDADPVAAAEDAGMPNIAVRLEQEIRELVALAERVAYDDAFRTNLEADPMAALDAAGIPEAAAEQLWDALDVPDEVRARTSEVVAHHQQELPLRAHLLILLLGNTAVTERMRTAPRDA